MNKQEFLAQLVEWGYDPNRMLAHRWNENGFHTLDHLGSGGYVDAVVNGVEYEASTFVEWKHPEHYTFVADYYARSK